MLLIPNFDVVHITVRVRRSYASSVRKNFIFRRIWLALRLPWRGPNEYHELVRPHVSVYGRSVRMQNALVRLSANIYLPKGNKYQIHFKHFRIENTRNIRTGINNQSNLQPFIDRHHALHSNAVISQFSLQQSKYGCQFQINMWRIHCNYAWNDPENLPPRIWLLWNYRRLSMDQV